MKNNNKFSDKIQEISVLKKNIYKLRNLFDNINDENVKNHLKNIIKISDKIYKEVVVNTEKLDKIYKFNSYYIVTVEKIISKYVELKNNKINNRDSQEFFNKIEGFLTNVTSSFENLYQSLFSDEIIDIDAELKVMEKEMKI